MVIGCCNGTARSFGTMKGVPEEEEEEEEDGEVWSSLTTPPPKLPSTLVCVEEGQDVEDYLSGIPEPPDGGWGWAIVAASFLCNMVVDGISYSFGIFLIHFVDYYGSPKGKTAWVGSLLSGCYLGAGPVVSALTNKFGCRPVTMCGSVISCCAFLLSTIAPTVDVLMVTYGIIAGLGFGLIYLPAIVSVGYYFSTKRAFATGIAVCGSGMGAFVFAPLTQRLLDIFDWKGALMILAGLSLHCMVFGALMRPLEATPLKQKQDANEDSVPLTSESKDKADSGLVLMPEDAKKASLINTEPGVQSTLNLDQVPKDMLLLPGFVADDNLRSSVDVVPGLIVTTEVSPSPQGHTEGSSLGALAEGDNPHEKPPGAIKVCRSHINVKELQRRFTMPATMPASANVLCPTANNNYAVQSSPRGESWSATRRQQRRPSNRKDLARPLYRKDIFYSGSIVHLPQFRQSKHDIMSYVASVTTIPHDEEEEDIQSVKLKKGWTCPRLPKSMANTLAEALDFSLLRQPAFLLTCIANIFGMMGFYVPFVYITDSSVQKGVSPDSAAFLLSIIGITNLLGRLLFGWIVDRPRVRALDVNNACLAVSSIATFSVPFCYSYTSIVAACTFFGLFVSAYISLTSIILVDMVGLDKLTNSFGLLSLFRGAASIIGPPLAGTVYDHTGSYDIPFFLAGAFLMTSGVCTFFIPWLNRRTQTPIPIATVVVRPPSPDDSGRPESEPNTAL